MKGLTVQELIDELSKVEDKSRKVVVDCVCEIQSIEEYEENIELRY